MCFVAGTTGYDPVTKVLPEDVAEQTRNCFKVIASALKDGGFEMADLVRDLLRHRCRISTRCLLCAAKLGDIRPAATIVAVPRSTSPR